MVLRWPLARDHCEPDNVSRRKGDPTVIFDRRNPNPAAADRHAREILSIDLPLAGSSTDISSWQIFRINR